MSPRAQLRRLRGLDSAVLRLEHARDLLHVKGDPAGIESLIIRARQEVEAMVSDLVADLERVLVRARKRGRGR